MRADMSPKHRRPSSTSLSSADPIKPNSKNMQPPTMPGKSSSSLLPEKENTQLSLEVEEVERPRPAKRARVAVACTRCKTRKQKCNGVQPRCSNCKNVTAPCEYIVPSKSMPYGKYQYIKALESRVAELEVLLANAGLTDTGKDHWERLQRNEAFNNTAPSLDTPVEALKWISTSPMRQVIPNSSSRRLQDPLGRQSQSETNILKDLSLEAGGGYVGDGSSNITVGNIFRSLIQGKGTSSTSVEQQLSPKSDQEPRIEADTTANELQRIPDDVAETLVKAYLKHISTRWPALYPPSIQSLHERRKELSDPFEISTLNLVYASGARFLETTGVTGNFAPEQHYCGALIHLDSILQAHDIRSIQTLLLHAIYCLRAPRGLSAWTHVGLALRICIELGMHRKSQLAGSNLMLEMRKRIFWSCYCLDRQVSIILGRPFAISDRDIDVELPLDIDDNMDEPALQKYLHTTAPSPTPSTSLSCFIHLTRLRRIESSIQATLYRVDKPSNHLSQSIIDHFLSELGLWKDSIPEEFGDSDTQCRSYDGYHYYMIYYYKCLRLLLYPHIVSSPPSKVQPQNTAMLIKCAEACGGVCRTYKHLHRQTSVGFSLMALYSVFLSGLTLLYCTWISPKEVFAISTSNDINACSIVLYVITERWPGARKYRDAYESIKQGVLDLIEKGEERGRLEGDEGLGRTLRDVGSLHPEGRREFEKMVSDMIGEGGGVEGNANDENLRQAGEANKLGMQVDPIGISQQQQVPLLWSGANSQDGVRMNHEPMNEQMNANFIPGAAHGSFIGGGMVMGAAGGMGVGIGLDTEGGIDSANGFGMRFLDDFDMEDFFTGNLLSEGFF